MCCFGNFSVSAKVYQSYPKKLNARNYLGEGPGVSLGAHCPSAPLPLAQACPTLLHTPAPFHPASSSQGCEGWSAATAETERGGGSFLSTRATSRRAGLPWVGRSPAVPIFRALGGRVPAEQELDQVVHSLTGTAKPRRLSGFLQGARLPTRGLRPVQATALEPTPPPGQASWGLL